ncbi:MAG: hypothetical protein HYZ90_01325 [Candidatus Omnitrophica bacterium]|nr:hypothetical protein [Candidatus Omnitrophota bacterium]
MKRLVAAGLAFSLTLTLTGFRQTSGGQAPRTQRGVETGLEESQLQAVAERWFPGPNSLEVARGAVEAQARIVARHPNEVLFPIVSRPSAWLTPGQIDDFWKIQAPSFGISGGGGSAGVQMPIADMLEPLREGFPFAIIAVDDSGGDAGKRRPWTVIAVGDERMGLLNQLSETLKDLGSSRLSEDYDLPEDPPKTVKDILPEKPFSFRGTFAELVRSPTYRDRVFRDPKGLWAVTHIDVLMAVLDRVVLNEADALKEFPELEARIQQYQAEGRIGTPESYQDYPILKAALGNLIIHGVLLATGSIIEPIKPPVARVLERAGLAGLEELPPGEIHTRFSPLLDRLTANPPTVLAMDVDGVTTKQDGDLSEATRDVYDAFLQEVPESRLVLLTDISPGQLRDRVESRLGPVASLQTVSFPLSGGAYVNHVIPEAAVAVVDAWVQQMGGKDVVLRMDDKRKEFAANQITRESLDRGFDINRVENGTIVGIDIEFNKKWLAQQNGIQAGVDQRDLWVSGLQRNLRDVLVPEPIAQTLHKAGSGSMTWVPPKGQGLIQWAQAEGIDPANTLFVDDSAGNFLEFPDVAHWPGTLLYIGAYNQELATKAPRVIQVAKPGEKKPANGEAIARGAVQLVRAVHKLGGPAVSAMVAEGTTVGGKRRLDPQRIKQAELLLERSLGIDRVHVVLASTELTERYGVFSRDLARSKPNAKGTVLIGRIRPWDDAYDPGASKGDRENRQVFTVLEDRNAPGGYTIGYLDDSYQPTEAPKWELPPADQIPEQDQQALREASGSGKSLVLHGYPIAQGEIFRVELVDSATNEIRVTNLADQPWGDAFPELALSGRILPRLQELHQQGFRPVLTLIRGEDNYDEADTWHGNNALRHLLLSPKQAGSWVLYHGHEGDAPATEEAIALIDRIPPGGLYVIGPGSEGTSLRAVHTKQGMWQALERAVKRGVRVLLVLGISYDTGTHGLTYREQLEGWQLDYRIATENPKALLGSAITHVAINQLPPYDGSRLSNDLQRFSGLFRALEVETLGRTGPVSGALSDASLKVGVFSPGLEALQALSRVSQIAQSGGIVSEVQNETAYVNHPRLRVLAQELRDFTGQPAVRQRTFLLTKRLGGLSESGKFRGPRELQEGEASEIQYGLGVQVIHQPLVTVNTELRSDRGITQKETTARSDRAALAETYALLFTAKRVGLEEPISVRDHPFSVEELARQLNDKVGVYAADREPAREKLGVPFVIAGTQTDTQGREGLAYGLVLARMGFQVGFVVDTVEEEALLQESRLVETWRIVRIDNREIFTPEQAIRELQDRAQSYRVKIEGEPLRLGVDSPITEPLVRWLEDLGVRLPARAVRTADWLISEMARLFA